MTSDEHAERGTSSIGMATAVCAKQRDMTVRSTTANPDKSLGAVRATG
jgi:hypothetical protein